MSTFEKAKEIKRIKQNLQIKRGIGIFILIVFFVISFVDNRNIYILSGGIFVELLFFTFVVFPQYRRYRNAMKSSNTMDKT